MTEETSTASTPGAVVSSHVLPGTDVPNDFHLMLRVAEELGKATGGFMPEALRGKPGDILAVMLRARALNVPMAVAFDQLYVAKGKVGLYANFARALARRAGHRLAYPEYDQYHAVCLIQCRGESEVHEVTFTMQEAIGMGLTYMDEYGKGPGENYAKQPQNMMVARVTMRALRMYCPEVLMGLGADALEGEDERADMGVDSDVIAAVRAEHQASVRQVLRLADLTEQQPNGAARLGVLRELFVYGRDVRVLDFATDPTGQYSVRRVITEKMVEADQLAKAQSAGKAPAADPEAGPQTLEQLRALLDPDTEAPQDEKPAEDAGQGTVDQAATAPAAPRKRAARKAPAAKGAAKGAAKKAAPRKAPAKKAAAPRAKKAAAKKAPPAPAAPPAARAADRPADRPGDAERQGDSDVLPCGCHVDQVIREGVHANTCTDAR